MWKYVWAAALSLSSVVANTLPGNGHVIQANFLDGVRNCMRNHTDRLNDCILAQINSIQPQLAGGVPELLLPPLDPFRVPTIKFEHNEPPVVINAFYDNVLVNGITAFDLKYLDIQYDPVTREQRIALGLTIPRLLLDGDYRISGQVFLLPVEGDGKFSTVFDGVIAEGTGVMVPHGDRYMMDQFNIGFKIRNIKTKMENLFNGNQILSDTLHHFINENGQLILDELQPAITGHMNKIFKGLFNGLFSFLPQDLFELLGQNNEGLNVNSRVRAPTSRG